MPMVGGVFHEYVLLSMLAESLNMPGTRTVSVLVLVRTGPHTLVGVHLHMDIATILACGRFAAQGGEV